MRAFWMIGAVVLALAAGILFERARADAQTQQPAAEPDGPWTEYAAPAAPSLDAVYEGTVPAPDGVVVLAPGEIERVNAEQARLRQVEREAEVQAEVFKKAGLGR